MAAVSQIAAARGRRGLSLMPVRPHCSDPPRSSGIGDSFADRSPPPDTARPHSDPRKTSLRWTSHGLVPVGRHCALALPEAQKVATVSHIAAPMGQRGLSLAPVGRHCAGPARRKWRRFRGSQPHGDGEASAWSQYHVIALALPGTQTVATVSQIAAPPGMASSNLTAGPTSSL